MNNHRTTYRIHKSPSHVALSVWVNGANIGCFTVRTEEVAVLDALVATLRANGATDTSVLRGDAARRLGIATPKESAYHEVVGVAPKSDGDCGCAPGQRTSLCESCYVELLDNFRHGRLMERADIVTRIREWASVGRIDLYEMADEFERGEHLPRCLRVRDGGEGE